MIKARWREMSREDFSHASIKEAIAVLPIAAIEQHGPHLPTGTDAILADGYIARVIERLPEDLPLIFLPVQEIGWSEEHLDGAGTVTSTWQHLLPVWTDICLSVKRAGIERIIVINSHGGNVPLMSILIQDLRVHHGMIASATNWLRFGYPDGLFSADELAYGIHGGAVETSLMLAMAPHLVDIGKSKSFGSAQRELADSKAHLRYYGRASLGWMASDLNSQGVVGDAESASADKGQILLEHIVDQFLVYARDMQQMPLLDQGKNQA